MNVGPSFVMVITPNVPEYPNSSRLESCEGGVVFQIFIVPIKTHQLIIITGIKDDWCLIS